MKKGDVWKSLSEINTRVSALPTFPMCKDADEWIAICERHLPELKAAVLRVENLAQEYKTACKDLSQMLKAMRAEITPTRAGRQSPSGGHKSEV